MKDKVSVIATVYNEAGSIEALWHSLLAQTRLPDEVVIVDGGSTDGTLARLQKLAEGAPFVCTILSHPGCNIAQGRNLAIVAAHNPLIAATDAGVRLEERWLEELLAPFERVPLPHIVGGFFLSEPQTPFEIALGAVTLPLVGEINPATFNPSSRSMAFRREAWQAVGGYPEWLDYCEDLLFDFALRDAGFAFAFAPLAVARFRPRPTLGAFYKQYYRYARGDGKADFWLFRHVVRYSTYGGALLLLALALWQHPLWLLPLFGGLAAMLRTPFRRAWPQLEGLSPGQRLQVLAWVPLIRWTGDIAKMIGYPIGVRWRWRHAPSAPWPKRRF